jgi:hypothetical protein
MNAIKSLSDILSALPEHVALPFVGRPPRPYCKIPREARSAGDLPGRMFMGNLDPASVRFTGEGWSALYRDHDPGTWFEIKYERQSDILFFRESWNGHEFSGGCAASSFNNLIGFACGMFMPWVLDKQAGKDVQARFSVRYTDDTETRPLAAYFPDGRLKTIVYPIPVSMLRQAVAFHRELEQAPQINTSVGGYLVKGMSVVNFVEGAIPDFIQTPLDLFTYSGAQLGLPALEMPVWETPAKGPSALTLRRMHYLHVVTTPFRDLLRVLEALCRHGLIGRATTDIREGYPDAPEFRALVMPAGYDFLGKDIQYFDPVRQRRLFYPQICPSDKQAEWLNYNQQVCSSETDIPLIESISEQALEWIKAVAHTSNKTG